MNTLRASFELPVAGETYPCLLTMNAFRILTQEHGVKLDNIEQFIEDDPLTGLAALAHVGCKNASLISGKKFGMDFEVFAAQLLEDSSALEHIAQAFAAAMGGEPGNE